MRGVSFAFLILFFANSLAYAQGIIPFAFFKRSNTPDPATVQTQGGFNAGKTVTIAYSSAVATGNTLIACVLNEDPGSNPVASDTQSNTWVRVFNESVGIFDRFSCFYAANSNAGATSVTLGDVGTGLYAVGVIFEVSGLATTSPLDTWGYTLEDTPNMTATATTSASVSQAKGFTFFICADWYAYQTWSVSAGHTIVQQVQESTGEYIMAAGERDIKTGHTGTLSNTCTRSTDNSYFHSAILYFKAK